MVLQVGQEKKSKASLLLEDFDVKGTPKDLLGDLKPKKGFQPDFSTTAFESQGGQLGQTDMANFLKIIGQQSQEPLVRVSQFIPDPKQFPNVSTPAGNLQVIAGTVKGGVELLEGLTSPVNIALMAGTGLLGGTPALVRSIFSAAFAGHMTSGLVKEAENIEKSLKKAIEDENFGEAARIVTNVVGTAAFITGAGIHAVKSGKAGLVERKTKIADAVEKVPLELEEAAGSEIFQRSISVLTEGKREIAVGELKPKPTIEITPKKELPQTIALKKTEIERIRADTGIDQLEKPVRRKWAEVLNRAKKNKVNETSLELADKILDPKLKAKERSAISITDEEHAGMVIKASQLMDEYNASIVEINKFQNKGDVSQAASTRLESERIIDSLDRLTLASDVSAREAARVLSIRRMALTRETFDIASITQRARASKGDKLNIKQTSVFEDLAREVKEAQKQVKIEQKKSEKAFEEIERVEAENEVLRLSKQAQREIKKASITKKTKTAQEIISQERVDIKKDLEKLGLRVNDVTGLTSEGSFLVGKLALNYIKSGATSLKEVVGKVKIDLPDLSAREVYEGIISKNPRAQIRARSAVVKQINELKKEARILVNIEKAEQRLKVGKSGPLKKQLTDLRTQVYKSGAKPNQLEKQLQTINELQDLLANIKKAKTPPTAEIKLAREKLAGLRKEIRVEDEIVKLNEQLKKGEFEVKEKPVTKEIPVELEKKQIELQRVKRKVKQAIDDVAPFRKAQIFSETVNILRTLKATADMSGALRQGFMPSVNLLRTGQFGKLWEAHSKGFKAFFSTFTADQVDLAIRSAEHHYIRERSGLFLSEVDGVINKREELFGSRFLEKVPGLGKVVTASNRHMVTTLNLLRTAAFDQFLMKNPNATRAELKAWANWVNIMSGRGDLTKGMKIHANALSTVIFSPRFSASRLQTPFMLFKHWKQPRVRKEIAKDYAAIVMVGSTALGLAALAGLEVGLSLRDSDFGKIIAGKTRIDIWAGVQQPMRLLIGIGIAATDKLGLTGKDLSELEKRMDPIEMIGRFSVYKLGPGITLPRELITGRTAVGQPTTPSETAVRSVIPFVIEDTFEAFKEEGVGRAGLVGGLVTFGIGVNTFSDSQSRTRIQIMRFLREGNEIRARMKAFEWNSKNPANRIKEVTVNGNRIIVGN